MGELSRRGRYGNPGRRDNFFSLSSVQDREAQTRKSARMPFCRIYMLQLVSAIRDHTAKMVLK